MDIAALASELSGDPLTRGYSGMSDAAAAASLNDTIDRTRYSPVTSAKLLAWSASSGRIVAIKTASESHADDAVKSISLVCYTMVSRDGTEFDADNSDHIAMIDGLIAGGVLQAADKTSLLSLATENISRATELGLGLVKPGHVGMARG